MAKRRTSGLAVTTALAASIMLGSQFVSPASAADTKESWFGAIAQEVAKNQSYPRSALNRELEGAATVKITVDRNGEVVAFELVESTGHSVLDREAERVIKRINPFPTPPAAVSDEDLTFLLPLKWVLR